MLLLAHAADIGLQADGEDAEEWEQWPDADVDISSSDDDAAVSDSDASMYSGGRGSEGGPRTRAQRRAKRRGPAKRQRASPDGTTQRARKRRRLQESQYAEGASDEIEELEELEEVRHPPFWSHGLSRAWPHLLERYSPLFNNEAICRRLSVMQHNKAGCNSAAWTCPMQDATLL